MFSMREFRNVREAYRAYEAYIESGWAIRNDMVSVVRLHSTSSS